MARLLIVFALLAFIVLLSRRRRALRAPRRDIHAAPGIPQRLICGACGAEFDPEKSGWICPKCGK